MSKVKVGCSESVLFFEHKKEVQQNGLAALFHIMKINGDQEWCHINNKYSIINKLDWKIFI